MHPGFKYTSTTLLEANLFFAVDVENVNPQNIGIINHCFMGTKLFSS